MFWRSLMLVPFALLLAAPSRPIELLRERQSVTVGGRAETWQLVWEGKPRSVCGPQDIEMAMTCPCTGFAYGELGRLSLVRRNGAAEIERLPLGPFFQDLPESDAKGLAAMQWRPMLPGDLHRAGEPVDAAFLEQVRRRPGPRVMLMGDYDRDGQASEFLVQVSAGPCGHTEYMLVGVSRAQPRLHGFGSADHPQDLLVLPGSAWQALLTNRGTSSVTAWQCGDHGSDVRQQLLLSSASGAIRVRQQTWSCPDDGQKERLLKDEVL